MVQRPWPRERPLRHARRRSIPTVLTLVCMTAALAACGRAQAARARISLLPSTTAQGHAWRWTAACRFAPHAATGCATAGPDLGVAQLAGDQWNLGRGPATTGAVRMSVSPSGGLAMEGDLSDAPPCTDPTCIAPEANTWVRGYPSILYGIDQCNAKTSPPQARELRLPAKVRSIPADLVGTTTYDARTSQVTHDIAYDLWLNASDTKTPCRTDGTIEVMVWTDHDARSLLPDSLRVGTASVPVTVNGTVDPGNQAWAVYASNVYRSGHTVPWGGTVWLVLDQAHAVAKGTVSVDLGAALAAVGTLLQDNYGWSDFTDGYWLDTIAFGMEFGPQSGNPYGGGPAAFSLDLTSYCLETRTTVAAAGC
jgi:hypothetical protein